MDKSKSLKKLLAFFLVFTLVFGVFLPAEIAFADPVERVETKATKLKITDEHGVVPPNGFHKDQRIKLKIDWDASFYGDQLKLGDYFTVTLPNELSFPNNAGGNTFDLYAENGTDIVGKGLLTPNHAGGGTVLVTFSKYVEDKADIKGIMELRATFAKAFRDQVGGGGGSYDITTTINASSATDNITMRILPQIDEVLSKWSGVNLTEEGYVAWAVRINFNRLDLHNVVLTDKLNPLNGDLTDIEYVPGSFVLEERNIDPYGQNIGSGVLSKTNVSDQVQITENGTAFSYTLGDTNRKQYMLHYKTTYKTGLKLRNNVTMTSDGQTPLTKGHTFFDKTASGQGDADLKSKIKIIKKDETNEYIKLPNVVFEIKKPNGETFNLKTNSQGEVVSGKLAPGTYKVKEITPHVGYQLDSTEHDAVVATDRECILTINNKPIEKIDVNVTKTWENFVGDAPAIRLQLLKDGQAEGNSVELSNGRVEYTWRNLPKTDSQGTEYTYSVKEVGENNNDVQIENEWYKVTYGGDVQNGLTITNKKLMPWEPIVPPTREVKVSKVWQDSTGSALAAPVSEVEVELFKDNVTTGKKLKLKASNHWTDSFKGLAVSETLGSANYQYTVKEVGEANGEIKVLTKWYDVNYEGTMADGFTITNKQKISLAPIVPPTRDISVNKVWQDSTGSALAAPVSEVEVELFKDNVTTNKKLTLKAGNNWTDSFKDLPVSETLGSANYQYTVKEVGENSGAIELNGTSYAVSYSGDMTTGYSITNKKDSAPVPPPVPTRDISVSKVWQDSTGSALAAPVSEIEVELFKDNMTTGKKLTLKAGNNWQDSFRDLAVSDGSGTNHNYTIKEVDENSGAIELNGTSYAVSYSGDMTTGYSITNKKDSAPVPPPVPTRDISVNKVWQDASGSALAAPVEKIEVELIKDGVATGNKLELKADNNWQDSFRDLAVSDGSGTNHNYTVKEVDENSGAIELNGTSYTVSYSGDMTTGYSITNKKGSAPVPPPVPTRDISVSKVWQDSTGSALAAPVSEIEVELFKDNMTTGKKLTLKAGNNWQDSFRDLAVSDGSGTNHNYTIKEVGEGNNAIELENKWYDVAYEGTMDAGLSVINKERVVPPATREVNVSKVWQDALGNALAAPAEKVEVELFKDGVATGNKLELKAANNWQDSFRDLPVSDGSGTNHSYTVKEVGEDNGTIQLDSKSYTVSYKGSMALGYYITNKENPSWPPIVPPTREVIVSKEWKDNTGSALVAPVEKIEVELLRNGHPTGEKLELKKEDNWTNRFINLPITDSSNNNYSYTVKEVGESDNKIILADNEYKVLYKGSMTAGFIIENEKQSSPISPNPPNNSGTSTSSLTDPIVLEIKVSKAWKSPSGSSITPNKESIIVELYKEGKPTGKTLELNAGNNWSGVFKDLEAVNSPDSANYYKYTIREVGENGNSILLDEEAYKVTYERNSQDGYVVTNEKTESLIPQNPTDNTSGGSDNQSINSGKDSKEDSEAKAKAKAKTKQKSMLPQTGDGLNLSLYALMLLALGGLFVIIGYRRNAKK